MFDEKNRIFSKVLYVFPLLSVQSSWLGSFGFNILDLRTEACLSQLLKE